MNEFCVALLQLLPEETQEGNLQKGLEACRRAKAMGADLALFPEVWNIGYRLEQPPEALAEAASADKKRAGGDITLVIPKRIGLCALKKIPVGQLPAVIRAGLEG